MLGRRAVPNTAVKCLLCSIVSLAAVGAVPQDPSAAGKTASADVDRRFQNAVSYYEAKRYAEAQRELEPVVSQLPGSFDANELMGLVYAGQGRHEKAQTFFEKAVRLKPDSAQAHTALAINLVNLKQQVRAETEFRKAVELEPRSFDSNHNLGEFYVRSGKLPAAIPYLERAQKADPASYENGYDLALAHLHTRDTAAARREIQALVQQHETAELHGLLGEVEEKTGNFLAAEKEYERAARMEPSEGNLFDWGNELLLHQALDPAIEVFTAGLERHPRSPRLQIGLGIALYARSRYDEAVKALSRATDLDPADSRPYLFLAKAYNVSTAEAQGVTERLERFAALEPHRPEAQYYYALSLWKGSRDRRDPQHQDRIELLLKRSIALDPKFSDARLQLGILYADQHKYAEAVREYQQAIRLNPDLADAHYRLAQALVRSGEKARAQNEFALYDRLHRKQLAETEKRRSEIKQFVDTMREKSATGGRP